MLYPPLQTKHKTLSSLGTLTAWASCYESEAAIITAIVTYISWLTNKALLTHALRLLGSISHKLMLCTGCKLGEKHNLFCKRLCLSILLPTEREVASLPSPSTPWRYPICLQGYKKLTEKCTSKQELFSWTEQHLFPILWYAHLRAMEHLLLPDGASRDVQQGCDGSAIAANRLNAAKKHHPLPVQNQ